jgi:hypothetical protein
MDGGQLSSRIYSRAFKSKESCRALLEGEYFSGAGYVLAQDRALNVTRFEAFRGPKPLDLLLEGPPQRTADYRTLFVSFEGISS